MNQITKLTSICNREKVKLEVVKAPRYIIPFLVDCEEDIILIRKEGSMPTPIIKVKEEPEEEFDLTGSPLHTSLDDSLINNPMIQEQANVNEYYNHSPLSVDQARRIINLFTCSGNPSFEEKELPLWALCDAADESRTVLMTLRRRDDGWVARGKAVLTPLHLFVQNSNPSLAAMLKGHHEIPGSEMNVSYLANACYNCNINENSEMVDEFRDNGAALKMHLSWKRPLTHFSSPPYDATSNLEMNITVGCEGSVLWQDIEKLQEINSLMETIPVERENQLLMTMASMNITVMSSSIRAQVHSYVCTGKLPPSLTSAKPLGANKIGIAHVLEIYKDVTEGRRHDVDVTEVLWNILKGCNDLVELNSCFKMIIREAASGRFTPKILSDNKTSLAKVIQGAHDVLQSMSLQLKGNEALRMLWELGYLKLRRDYNYVFQRLELKTPGLSDTFKGPKTLMATKQERDEGIESLVASHFIIEILMVLKTQLNLEDESLSLLATSAISKLFPSVLEFAKSSVGKSLDCSLLDSGLQKMVFSIPVPTKLSIPLVKGCNPESWSFRLSSVKKKRKVVTIYYEHNHGIFPPEIYEKGDNPDSGNKDNPFVKFTLLSDHFFLRN